jgi:hypothetical protein
MSESASFREDLIQAVDYGLAVRGGLVHAAIFETIERHYPLARDEIPDKLETFDRVLHDLLGTSAKSIHNNLGLTISSSTTPTVSGKLR